MKTCKREGCTNPIIIHKGIIDMEFPICQKHMDAPSLWNPNNLPEKKFGYCENNRHEDDVDQQKESLSLILFYDEESNSFEGEIGDYWCDSCCEKDLEYQ